MNRNLGAALSAIERATFPAEDYALARQGDCVAQVNRAQLRAWDRAAQSYGFRDASHLRAEVEARTSPRWAFFNLPWYAPES